MQSNGLKLDNLSYIILYVKDSDKATAFYRDVLGVALKFASPGWVEFNTGSTTLALHPTSEISQISPKSGPEVCFTVDDIHAAFSSLKEQGVNFFKEPHVVSSDATRDYLAANFHDLDGNQLAIYGSVRKS